ncbi:MAG: DUF5050 domain-containing protein [Sarcina sp.]
MKRTILLVPILLGGVLVSCGGEEQIKEEKRESIKVSSHVKAQEEVREEETFLVEASSQEMYSSRVLQTENDYFYSSISDNNRIYRNVIKNENQNNPKSEVSMLSGTDLIHFDGKVYYSNSQDNGKIYFFETKDFNEDVEAKPLNIHSSRDLVACDDGIFYINQDDNEKIYFISYDGKINKAVTQDRAPKFIVADYKLYYQNANDGYNLYVIDLKENKRIKLTDFSVESFTATKGFILVTNSDDNNSLYFVKSNENIEKLSNRKAFELKSDLNKKENDRNKIYYINEERELVEADLGSEMKIQSERIISKTSVENYYFTTDKIIVKDEEEMMKAYNK